MAVAHCVMALSETMCWRLMLCWPMVRRCISAKSRPIFQMCRMDRCDHWQNARWRLLCEADEVAARYPEGSASRRWLFIDAPDPSRGRVNFARILVGSEGTLPTPRRSSSSCRLSSERAVGVCQFASFHAAMIWAQHLVKLKPIAIELVDDDNMIALARDIAVFRPSSTRWSGGELAAVPSLQFAENPRENVRLEQLDDLMYSLALASTTRMRVGAAWYRSSTLRFRWPSPNSGRRVPLS